MRANWSSVCRASLALAAALLARHAHGEPLAPTLLSYRAPDGCPEVAEFQKSVQRRSARVRFVDEGSHERELSIALSKDGQNTIGELRLIERDGSLRQRNVRFSSCAEAVEGLALITVVSLDPQAILEPAPKAAAPEEPTPKPAAKPEAPQPLAAATLAPIAPRAAPGRLETALGGEFVAGFHELPQTALGGALFVDLASNSPSWFAPLLRIALAHSERRGVSAGDAEANFALTEATLAACPVRLGDRAISLRPCAFTSLGALRVWSSDDSDPHARTRPHWAWGGSAFVFLRVSQITDITADFGVASTLIRDRFELQQTPFWQTRALYLSTGIGLRFVFR